MVERYGTFFMRPPIIELLKIHKNFSRVSPVLWIFLFSLTLIILGISIHTTRIFMWLGGLVILLYASALFLWVHSNT